jgi:hypothetical protein
MKIGDLVINKITGDELRIASIESIVAVCEYGEYSVRKKQAQAIREKEFLSWQSERTSWPTITVNGNHNRKGISEKSGDGLSTVVQKLNWPTPNTMDSMDPKTKKALLKEITETRPGRSQLSNLRDVVVNPVDIMKSWGTPTSRDYKDGTAESVKNVPENGLLGRMIHSSENQLHDPDKFSTNGSDPEQFRMLKKRLNPHWVCQLMGTDFEKIFFVHLETPYTVIAPSSHLEHYQKSMD